jgi:hypothetical protein
MGKGAGPEPPKVPGATRRSATTSLKLDVAAIKKTSPRDAGGFASDSAPEAPRGTLDAPRRGSKDKVDKGKKGGDEKPDKKAKSKSVYVLEHRWGALI